MMLLLLALCVSLSAAVQSTRHIFGELNSPMNLSSVDPEDVIDATWTFLRNETETQIAKTKNGVMVENLGNRYKLFNNGTVLGIDNLTRNDLGRYVADVTYSNHTSEERNIMLLESPPAVVNTTDQKNVSAHIEHFPEVIMKIDPITISISVIGSLIFLMIFMTVLWKCWKRSSNPTGQEIQECEFIKGHTDESDNFSKQNHRHLDLSNKTSANGVTKIQPDLSNNEYSKQATEHQHGQQEVIEMMPLMKTTETTN